MNLAHDLAMALDPVIFAHEAGLDLDPWQCDVARSDARRVILLCSRQSGKSTTTAAIALHDAIYHDSFNILLLSPSLRQSSELFRRVLTILNNLPDRPDIVEENKLSLQLGNRSRIVSLPASEATVRSFTANKIIIDEAARVSDELYRAVRPMLATTNGQLTLMSSPWGRRGFFYEEWHADQQNPDDTWKRVRITAEQCPRIPAKFLADEKRSMGEVWYNSEYLCQFAETVNSVFRYEDVDGAFSDDIAPLFATAKAPDEDSGLSPLFFAL